MARELAEEEEPLVKSARVEIQMPAEDFTRPSIPERSRKFCLRAIVDERLASSSVPLTEMHAVKIEEGRAIAKVLPLLPPLPVHLGHLKRIYRGAILLTCTTAPLELTERLRWEISNVVVESKPHFFAQKVPALKASTKAQFEFAKQHWPSTFHEDKGLESKLNGSHFGEEELRNLSLLFAKIENTKGALIYDPIGKRVVADVSERPAEAESGSPLAHPAMRCIDQLAEQHTCSIDGLSQDQDESGMHYLATGFDVLLHREPCTMCAMALVHCRAKRVFFTRTDPQIGALLSKWLIQEVKELNHHYEVFQMIEHKAESSCD